MIRCQRTSVVLFLVVVAGVVACKKSDSPPDDTGPAMADRTAAAIVITANEGEIDLGQLAQLSGQSAEVKQFATRMISDHTATLQRQRQLVQRLEISPLDSALNRQLQSDARNMADKLRMLTGDAFDRAYIDGQVQLHAQVLNLLDSNLIPNAQSPEVRADLGQMRVEVSDHLRAARSIQLMLGSGAMRDGGLAGVDGGLIIDIGLGRPEG